MCIRDRNGSSSDHPKAFLVSSTSSSPRGAPCASAESCLLGLPYPMCVRTMIKDGCSSSSLACPMAASVSYTHLRAHETKANLVCRLLLEKKKIKKKKKRMLIHTSYKLIKKKTKKVTKTHK